MLEIKSNIFKLHYKIFNLNFHQVFRIFVVSTCVDMVVDNLWWLKGVAVVPLGLAYINVFISLTAK